MTKTRKHNLEKSKSRKIYLIWNQSETPDFAIPYDIIPFLVNDKILIPPIKMRLD